MATTLHYGRGGEVTLDLPPGTLVAECVAPRGDVSGSPMLDARQALDQPAGFPPLSQSVVPGDKVVVALEAAVPDYDAVVAAVVQSVIQGGALPADITVLRTLDDEHAEAPDPRALLAPEIRKDVKLQTHDPEHREQLSFLTSTPKGRPIYLNRLLCDADLVVLVGCMRPEHAVIYHGARGALYPTFSDAATQRRFRHPGLINGDADLIDRARGEVRRVGWLAGTQFTVQVVPGADDTALAIIAGEPEAVERAGASVAVRRGNKSCLAARAWCLRPSAEVAISKLGTTSGERWPPRYVWWRMTVSSRFARSSPHHRGRHSNISWMLKTLMRH